MDTDETRQKNQKAALRIITSLAIIITLALLTFGIIRLIESLKSASLLIYIAPSTATVTINGQDYSNGVYRFYPGTVTAEIHQDGFDTKTEVLELQNGQVTKLITYLAGKNNDFSWYVSHDEDLSILRQTSDDESSEAFLETYEQELAKAEQIKDAPDLPYTARDADGNTISIVYTESSNYCPYYSTKPCLIMAKKVGNASYNLGFDLLREHGYNPDYFNIVYQ